MLVHVTIEERPGLPPTIEVASEDQVTVRVRWIKREGDRKLQQDFEAVLPDQRIYPPLIP